MDYYSIKTDPLERCRRVRASACDDITKDNLSFLYSQTRVLNNRINYHIRREFERVHTEHVRGEFSNEKQRKDYLHKRRIKGIVKAFKRSRQYDVKRIDDSIWYHCAQDIINNHLTERRYIMTMRKKTHEQSLTLNKHLYNIQRADGRNFLVSVPSLGLRVRYKLKGKLPEQVTRIKLLLDAAGLDIVVYYRIQAKTPNQTAFSDTQQRILGIDLGMKETAVCSDGFRLLPPKAASRYQRIDHLRIEKDSINRTLSSVTDAEQRKALMIKRRQINAAINYYHGVAKAYALAQKDTPQWHQSNKKLRYMDKYYRRQLLTYIGQLRYHIYTHADAIAIETLESRKRKGNTTTLTRRGKDWARAGYFEINRLIGEILSERQTLVIRASVSFPSTCICSRCHKRMVGSIATSIRQWRCPSCGAVHDRDLNAAKNLEHMARHHPFGNVPCHGIGSMYADDVLGNPYVWVDDVRWSQWTYSKRTDQILMTPVKGMA